MPGPGSTPCVVGTGFAASEASLATSFEVATPRLQPSPVSVDTSRLMAAATAAPGPNSRCAPVTSRNASSREIGSTSGV